MPRPGMPPKSYGSGRCIQPSGEGLKPLTSIMNAVWFLYGWWEGIRNLARAALPAVSR
jgi:hypothetical protein